MIMKKIYHTPYFKTVSLSSSKRSLQESEHDSDMDFDNPGDITPAEPSDW